MSKHQKYRKGRHNEHGSSVLTRASPGLREATVFTGEQGGEMVLSITSVCRKMRIVLTDGHVSFLKCRE